MLVCVRSVNIHNLLSVFVTQPCAVFSLKSNRNPRKQMLDLRGVIMSVEKQYNVTFINQENNIFLQT